MTKTYPLAARIEVCDRLGDLVDSVVIGSMPRSERAGSGERLLLARWAHAQTNYGAAMNLAREPEADGQSVAMLSRPLFEAMIDCYWIVKEPIKSQDLAVKHHRLLRIIVAEDYNAWRLPGDPAMPVFAEDRAEQESFAELFKPRAQKHWTTLDLRSRVRAVDQKVPQHRPGELEHQYDVDNQLANLLLHGSPMSMNDRLKVSARGITVQVGPTQQHLANALRHAFWSYYRLGWLMARQLVPDRAEELEADYRAGWPKLQTITDGALKKAGRNGACPCGSERKSKDCHGAL